MARGHIMGSKPERDPLEEVSRSSLPITRDTELRWMDRDIRPRWIPYLITAMTVVILTNIQPWLVILATLSVVAFAFLIPEISNSNEMKSISDSEWTELDDPDISITTLDDTVQVRGIGGNRHFALLEIKTAPPRLAGNLGKVIRAIDPSIGFFMAVTLGSADIADIQDNEHFPDHLEAYLDTKSGGEMEAYLSVRGGLWKTHVSFMGIVEKPSHIKSLENALRGAIPGPKIQDVPSNQLEKKLSYKSPISDQFGFYTSGRDLKDWLVQLSSELASEVGSTIPGQFISPIRGRPGDYPIGVSINPDTLLTGPSVGLSKMDLETGLLVCGGSWSERRDILSHLLSHLLNDNKRVLLISSSPEALELTGYHESSIGLTLGREFVLNPIDAESVPRNEFVSTVKTALEVIAETDLSSAADFELALNKAASLGNATVADISLSTIESTGTEESKPEYDITGASKAAMDALRVLHQGVGARAFYGHQTVSVQQLAEQSLSVLVLSTGSIQLDMFAWDILCSKIAWTQPDEDLVVILDEPLNLLVNTTRYKKRLPWSIRVTQRLNQRGPLIVSVNSPQPLPSGVTDFLSSCIALRLRSKYDIAVVSDILGLTVISTGLHSKQRVSPRESSYLRVLKPGMALLVRDDTELCLPVKLDTVSIPEAPTSTELESRLSAISTVESTEIHEVGSTLLDRVSGSDRDATLRVLRLLKKYEPLTEEAIRKFMSAGDMKDIDFEGILARLENANMILRGHEVHSGVSYTNYRVTMKGDMALRQLTEVGGDN